MNRPLAILIFAAVFTLGWFAARLGMAAYELIATKGTP